MAETNGYQTEDLLHTVLAEAGLGGDSSKLSPPTDQNQNSNNNSSTSQNGSGENTPSGGGTTKQVADTNTPAVLDDATLERVMTDRFKLTPAQLTETLQEVQRQKELLGASPYKSSIGGALDDLLSQGIDASTAIQYLQTDIATMDDRAIIALDMRLANPKLTEQEVNRLIDRKYGLGDYKKSDAEEADGLLEMKVNAGPVRARGQELKDKMLSAGTNRDQIASQHRQADRVKTWNQAKANLEEDFTKLNIAIAFDKDGKPTQQLPFSIENRAELEKEFETIINSMPNLSADEKGIKLVKAIIRDRAILTNLPKIIRTALTTSRSQNDQWWANFLENPNLGNPNGNGAHTATSQLSSDEQIAQNFLSAYGFPK